MKKTVIDFIRRGLAVCGFGPIVLAVLYLILHHQGLIQTLTVKEVSVGICSLAALAFIAGGMNVVYQIERLPLMVAILIQGTVLYIGYLGTYLLNNWLEWSVIPVLVFSAIFVIGYVVIWAIIYSIIKKNTAKLNQILAEKNKHVGDGV